MSEAEIFAGALKKLTPADRAEFLAQVCGSNVQLRHRIAALLSAHEAPDHERRGEKDAAREWFNRAVAWWKKTKSDAEFQRIRAEAAALIGPEVK